MRILFNPRIDIWGEHFQLEGDRINPKTSIGNVTARILKFNLSERLIERRVLIGEGKYPGRKAE